jgi:hypothetical protein
MGFFETELTEIELVQKEIDRKTRTSEYLGYIVDEDNFVEIKIGENNDDKLDDRKQLPAERNHNISDR